MSKVPRLAWQLSGCLFRKTACRTGRAGLPAVGSADPCLYLVGAPRSFACLLRRAILGRACFLGDIGRRTSSSGVGLYVQVMSMKTCIKYFVGTSSRHGTVLARFRDLAEKQRKNAKTLFCRCSTKSEARKKDFEKKRYFTAKTEKIAATAVVLTLE